jgi:hypothetical protein
MFSAINNIEMPIRQARDKNGSYYAWGFHGRHYYYTSGNAASRVAAKRSAEKQMRAAYSAGYRGK